MLHYCRIEDILNGLTVAPRFETDLRGIRDIVTQKINTFIRRNLEFVSGKVEYFDTPDVAFGRSYNIWLEKKNVLIPSIEVGFSTIQAWDDNILPVEQVDVDEENGKLVVYGYIRSWVRGLRVVYDGGFLPRDDDDEVMDVPDGLRYAAAQQCIFEGRQKLNGDQGTAVDDDKKTPVKMMGNLLQETALAFIPYRRPLGQ